MAGLFDDLLPGAAPAGGGMFDDLVPKAPEKKALPERTKLAAVNDTVIEAANAVAGGVGSIANFVAPGNRVSSFIDENIVKPGQESQSDRKKAINARLAQDIAGAQGVGDQVGAALRYAKDDPAGLLGMAAGSFAIPLGAIKGAGMLAKSLGVAEGAATKAALAGGALTGAALSGGDAAGQAYEESLKAGATEEQAQAAARQASVIPAIVGGAGGMLGAERIFAGAKGFKGNAISRALKTGASEGAQEFGEEFATQYEANRAVAPYDGRDPMQGAVAAGTLGALAGAPIGMLTGAVSPRREDEPKKPAPTPEQKAAKVLAAGSVDEAIKAAQEATIGKPAGGGLDRLRGILPDEQRREVIGLMATANNPNSPPNVRRFAEQQIDAILREYTDIPAADVVEEAELLPTPDAKELTDEERAAYVNAPSNLDRLRLRKPIPTGEATDAIPAADAQEIEPIPAGEASEEIPAPDAYEVPPVGEASEVIPTGDAMEVPRIPTGKATEIEPETVQADDLLTGDGMPYGSKTAANVRARREGLGPANVVEIPGAGWVVRPQPKTLGPAPINAQPAGTRGTTAADILKAPNVTDPARTAGPRPADAGRGDGAGVLPVVQTGDVAAGAAAPSGQGVDGGGAAGPGAGGRDEALKSGLVMWQGREVERKVIASMRGALATKLADHEQELKTATLGKKRGDSSVARKLRQNVEATRSLLAQADKALGSDLDAAPPPAKQGPTPQGATDEGLQRQGQGRREEVAAGAQAEVPAPTELPRLPFEAYRVERRYANGAVIRPLPGKAFTDGEVQQIAGWFRAAKWEVSTAAPSGISAVNNANMSADDIPEPYTAAQRKRDERQRETDTATAAKAAAQDDYLTSTAAGKYVTSTFGDTLNKFNSTALAKFLAGDADTFAGLMNARAADVVQGLGIAVEGRTTKDVLADLRARFAAPAPTLAERVKQRREKAAEPAPAAPVSSVEGQKGLAYRGSRIASLMAMNEQIRKLDPTEAWHPDNIRDATDLDGLQDSISSTLVRLQRKKESAAAPAATATHKDPGQPAEPATAPVIAQALSKAAVKEALSRAAMKAEALRLVDAAIAAAPKEGSKKITIKVPGDGTFTVVNNVARLRDFRRQIELSPGFKEPRGKPPIAKANSSADYGPDQLAREMLEDGEPMNAVEALEAAGKTMMFGNGGDARPIPYTNGEPVEIEGIADLFVGRGWSTKKGSTSWWSVVHKPSGFALGTSGGTKAEAIAEAKKLLAQPEKRAKLAEIAATGKSADGKPFKTQDELRTEFMAWAEKHQQETLNEADALQARVKAMNDKEKERDAFYQSIMGADMRRPKREDWSPASVEELLNEAEKQGKADEALAFMRDVVSNYSEQAVDKWAMAYERRNKPTDTGWQTGFQAPGGYRRIRRDVTLPDGTTYRAELDERAGAYVTGMVQKWSTDNGTPKNVQTFSNDMDARRKADQFMDGLTAKPAPAAPAPAPQPEPDNIPEAGIASQTFDQWVRAKYNGNEYKASYLKEFGGDEKRAMLGAAVSTIDSDRSTADLLKAARIKYHGELMDLPREASISLEVWDALDNTMKLEAQRHFFDLDARITRRDQDATKARVEAEKAKKAPYEAAFAEVDAEIRRLDKLPGPITKKQNELSARRDRLREAIYQIGQGKEPDGRLLRAPQPEVAEAPAAERYEAGRALTKEQRKQVLASLVDVYKAKGADREQKGIGRDGNERYGYVHSPELFEKSDITGAMVRYYVTLPDGRRAHPTELFPDYTLSDIEAEMQRRDAAERNDAAEQKRVEDRLKDVAATTPAEARAEFDKRNPGTGFGWNAPKDRTYLPYTKDGKFYTVMSDDVALQARLKRAGWMPADQSLAPARDEPKIELRKRLSVLRSLKDCLA